MASRSSALRLATAALHRQNGWLRRNIQIEGESIAALPASSGLRKTMKTYNARLLAAVGHNDEVLHTLFGAPPSFEWPWAAWQWPWATSDLNVETYNGLGSVWRHLAKDWSAEGHAGLQELHAEIGSMVATELNGRAGGSVLLPGCGTARLAWELSNQLPDALVIGTDTSAAQLAVARHMLGCTQPGTLSIHPFLEESKNNADDDARLTKLVVPDVAPGPPPANLVLALQPPSSLELLPGAGAVGDASTPGTDEPLLPRQVDVVVTCFFLDCLPDTLSAVRAIRDALAPGGVWVFAGPLEYHHWPGLVPTLSQLRELAHEEGLEPLGEPRFVSAPYLGKAGSLLHRQQYRAALFACRRRKDGGWVSGQFDRTT